ncbi:MAG: ATP-binding cassette domain-containing protein [Clostridiales bacterium]|jgi:ABC-type multidrug transport system ATPase subunit|nr:ATP-binding cassette domain-containing protein [Clostridiales bacterium]
MIELQHVTKSYGKTEALLDFSFSVTEPGIYCLLGRNGAGKTTLMKLLAGHIPATEATEGLNIIGETTAGGFLSRSIMTGAPPAATNIPSHR